MSKRVEPSPTAEALLEYPDGSHSVNALYQYADNGRYTKSKNIMWKLRMVTLIIAVLGVAGLVLSTLERGDKPKHLAPICSLCGTRYYVFIGGFAGLAILSLFGYYGLLCRDSFMRPILYTYFLLATGLIAMLLFFGFYPNVSMDAAWKGIIERESEIARAHEQSGSTETPSDSSWGGSSSTSSSSSSSSAMWSVTMTVSSGHTSIVPAAQGFFAGSETNSCTPVSELCPLQMSLRCSGWEYLCIQSEPYNWLQSWAMNCPICSEADQLNISSFTTSCRSLKVDSMNGYYSMLFPLTVAAFLVLLVAFVYVVQLSVLATETKAVDQQGPSGGYEMQDGPHPAPDHQDAYVRDSESVALALGAEPPTVEAPPDTDDSTR